MRQGDVTLTTRAHFDIAARVLSRKDYSWGADAGLVPIDLALGWIRVSDSKPPRWPALGYVDDAQRHWRRRVRIDLREKRECRYTMTALNRSAG